MSIPKAPVTITRVVIGIGALGMDMAQTTWPTPHDPDHTTQVLVVNLQSYACT